MDVLIREIEEKDFMALLPLWAEFGGYANAENIVRHYDRIKNDTRYKTYVAVSNSVSNNEIVGFITSVQYFGIGIEGSYMVIVGICVKQDLQGKGIGTKLMKRMEVFAKESNVFSIYLNSDIKRVDAHAFYERNGYRKHSYGFGKTI